MSESLKKFEIIKESINTFDDAEFVSIISEDTLLIKNTKTKEEFTVKYKYDESTETVLFNTNNSIVVTKNEILENSVYRKKDKLKNSIKSYLESEDNKESLDSLRDTISSLRFKNPIKELFTESETETEELSKPTKSLFYESSDKVTKKMIDNLNDKIGEKVNFYSELKNSFVTLGKIFNEDKMIDGVFLSPKKVIELFSEKNNLIGEMVAVSKKINDRITMIAENTEMDEDEIKTIFEGIDFSDEPSLTVSLTKNLVNYKKSTGVAININDFVKTSKKIIMEQKDIENLFVQETVKQYEDKLSKIMSLVLEYVTPNEDTSGVSKLTMLKFNTGLFQPNDVRCLKNDLDTVMRRVNDVNREDMMEIQGMRNTVEFMDRTGNINDEVVNKIVTSFNDKYGNKEAIDSIKKYSEKDLEKFRTDTLMTFKTIGNNTTGGASGGAKVEEEKKTETDEDGDPKDSVIEVSVNTVQDKAEEAFTESETDPVKLAIQKAKKKLAQRAA